MLDAAEAHLGSDGTLTLESAARAAGVTKPGLMYHFSTKEQLLSAILTRIAERYERGMAERLGSTSSDFTQVSTPQRHLAYLDWACRAPLSPADLVIFADPHFRVTLTGLWQEQLERWLATPAELSRAQRDRLLAVRLMADGVWLDRSSGLLSVTSDQADALRTLAEEMLEAAS